MKINCEEFIEDIRLKADLTQPRNLLVIQVGDNEASNLYIKSKIKESAKWNVNVLMYKFKNIDEEKLIQLIRMINYQSIIHGVIVQLPLPPSIDEQKVINAIAPSKNVDGFKQVHSEPQFTPCTPLGVMMLLGNVEGKTVTLIGRGKTVGKPLRELLDKNNATVIQCHSKTPKKALKEALSISDIVISAVGKPNLFNCDMLKQGAMVIDCGISRIDSKQVGDFNHEGLDRRNDIDYTPWIGGVGKLTVGALMMNVRGIEHENL